MAKNKAPVPIVGGISVTDGLMHTTQSLDELFEDNRPLQVGTLRI